MRRNIACVGVVVLSGLLCGCWPRARIVWSPDGRHAAVLGGDGLYVCDGEGRLSARLAGPAEAAAWLPDSRRFIAARVAPLTTWKALAAKLPAAARKRVAAEADAVRKEVLAYEGDWNELKLKTQSQDLTAVLIYLRDHDRGELAKKVGEKWQDLAKLERYHCAIELYRVGPGKVAAPALLADSLDPVREVRVSPTGKAFAYAAAPAPSGAGGGEDAGSLFLAATTPGGRAIEVADLVSCYFDFSPDGRRLLYGRATVPKPAGREVLRLGSLVSRGVCGDDGSPLQGLEGPRDLVGLLFYPTLRVRCLGDGTILFAASGVQLPATAEEMPKRLSLFALDPSAPTTLRRVLSRRAEDAAAERLDLFEVSPDGKRLAVPGGQGTVTVLTLATGKVETVQGEKDREKRLWTIPVWRSDKEVCFAAPAGTKLASPHRAEIVLHSPAGSRCISKDWPASVAKGLLMPEPKADGSSE